MPLSKEILSLRLKTKAMDIKNSLQERSGGMCELCENSEKLNVYAVPPFSEGIDKSILICNNCLDQITGNKPMDPNHWRCLNKSMWSAVPAIQVMAWRLLHALRTEGWPQDLLDMLYLDDDLLAWAKNGVTEDETTKEEQLVHRDSNGAVLQPGDSVVLIKDLDVKGGGFTAKRGTVVREIKLVENNPEHVEGKVNGQQIVILTKFVKKG
jgi:protein PhnA